MLTIRAIVSILIILNVIRIILYLLSDDIAQTISKRKEERSQSIETCDKRIREIDIILGMKKMWTYKKLLRGRRVRLNKEKDETLRKRDQLDRIGKKVENKASGKSDAITSSIIFILVIILIYLQITQKL